MEKRVNFILTDTFGTTKIYYVRSYEDFPLGIIRFSLSQNEYVFVPDGTYLNDQSLTQIADFLKGLSN